MKTIRLGTCVDCGKPFYLDHEYIVRNAVWAAAGMKGWASGLLHRPCLEKRLGRKVTVDEFLVWCVGRNRKGGCTFSAHPDYPSSPEFREGAGQGA